MLGVEAERRKGGLAERRRERRRGGKEEKRRGRWEERGGVKMMGEVKR